MPDAVMMFFLECCNGQAIDSPPNEFLAESPRSFDASHYACNMFFNLNSKRMSSLYCVGFGTVSAFSGNGKFVNDPSSTAVPKDGPLPVGTYYIVDRPSGGQHAKAVEFAEDVFSGTHRVQWFALYRAGGPVGDFTFVNGVRRGNFRLHPVGYWGISEGCITLPNPGNFDSLRAWLKSQSTEKIPGTAIDYYGKVIVK